MDCDSARATTITNAKMIPGRYDMDNFPRILIASRDPTGLPPDMLTLATSRYEDEAKPGPLLVIPRKVRGRRIELTQSPTMSLSFGTRSGARDSLNSRTRCGCSPCAPQICRTEVAPIPTAFDIISAAVQWVALF